MKTKAKLVLALSVLTAGTAFAGATGTFAWFSTNRSATLSYSKVTAYNNAGSLQVKIGTISDKDAKTTTTNTDKTDTTAAVHTVSAAASTTTDISSGDGVTFVKPVWTGEAGEGNAAEKLVTPAAGKEYVTYYFSVKNTGATSINVFLNKGTAIKATTATEEAQTAKNTAMANYTRIAINEYQEASTTDSGAPTSVKASKTKLVENNVGTTGKYLASLTDGKATSTAVTATDFIEGSTSSGLAATSSSTETSSSQFLTTLAQNTIAYYTVSVWLEGTKADGSNFDAAAGGSIDIDIVLSAYEVA